MNGVTKITSEQNVMMITFTDSDTRNQSLSTALRAFAKNNIVVDMICQSTPRANNIDFSFTTSYSYFSNVIKTVSAAKFKTPLISSGYTKINLFGEEMVTTCGVAANALTALDDCGIDVFMITTSDLDISLLIRAEQEDVAIESLKKLFRI